MANPYGFGTGHLIDTGETLRLASMALYRQAKKRFPSLHRPPRSVWAERLPEYQAWYDQVIRLYEPVGIENLTKAELKADGRMCDAICNANAILVQNQLDRKSQLIAAAELDPYGHLTWGIGDGDDFVCLDWGQVGGKFVFLSVLNSETGHFIQEFDFVADVLPEDAVRVAVNMADGGYEWCYDNDVTVDEEGWNFSAYRFVKDVADEVGYTGPIPFPSKPYDGVID